MSIVFAGNDAGYVSLNGSFPKTDAGWWLFGVKPDSPLPSRFQAIMVLAAWSGPGSPTAHILGITTEGKWQLNTNFGTGSTGSYPDGVGIPIGTATPGAWNFVAVRSVGGSMELVVIDLGTETLTKTTVGQVAFTPTRCSVGANASEAFDGKIAPIRWGSGAISDAQLIAQAKSLQAVSGQGTVVGNKSGVGADLSAVLEGELGGAFVVNSGGEAYVSADSDAPEYAEPEAGDNVFELAGSLDLRPQASIAAAGATGQVVAANGLVASYDEAASVAATLIHAATGLPVSGVTMTVTVDDDLWAASATAIPAGTYHVRITVTDEIDSVTMISSSFSVSSGVSAPGAPVLGNPEVTSPYAVKLSWTLPDSNATEIVVYRKSGPGGARTTVATLPAGTLEYSVTGLLAGTQYWFDVGARNSAGETRSAEKTATTLSNQATALLTVTPTSLAQPGKITATLGNPAGATLTAVQFLRNGAALGLPVISSPFSLEIALTAADNGLVEIGATGVDILSRNVSASPVTVTVAIETAPVPDPGDGSLTDDEVLELLANPIDPKFADEAFPYFFDFRSELQTGESLLEVEYVEIEVRGPPDLDPDSDAMLEGDPYVRGTLGIVMQRVQSGKPGVAYYLRCQARTNFDRLINSEIAFRVHATTGRRAVRL